MTTVTSRRVQAVRQITALGLLVSTVSGCSFTQTSTTVRSSSDPPVAHLRLARPDALALAGTFKQDGHAIVGQLSFGRDCASESTQSVHRQSVYERRTNLATGIAWAVVGGALAAVGTGFLVASQSADKRVFCGDGSAAPRDGDQCYSKSGAESEFGVATLLLGLTAATAAGIFLVRKPHVETTDLPPQQITRVTAPVACGSAAALDGLVVAAELPGSGKWTGRVGSDGSVRIVVSEKIALPEHASIPILVESAPLGIADLVNPGTPVGALTLSGSHAENSNHQLAVRH